MENRSWKLGGEITPNQSHTISLGSYTTVFQAEVIDILISARKLYVFFEENTILLSNSQATLRTLSKTQVAIQVLEC